MVVPRTRHPGSVQAGELHRATGPSSHPPYRCNLGYIKPGEVGQRSVSVKPVKVSVKESVSTTDSCGLGENRRLGPMRRWRANRRKNKPARSHSRCVRAPSGVSVLQASPQPVWHCGAWVFGDSGSIWTAHPLGRACRCEAEEVTVVTTRCPSGAGRRVVSLESLMLPRRETLSIDLDVFWLPQVWYNVDSGTGPVGHAGAMRQLGGLGLGSACCFISPDAVHIRGAW